MHHDTLMETFLQQLEIRGWTVCRAPTIPVRGGTPQKPDGVMYKDNQCWVINATIVADNANLNDIFYEQMLQIRHAGHSRLVPVESAFP